MKVCFIGASGRWGQAYRYLKTRDNIEFCSFAPGSPDEKRTDSIDELIPHFAD